MRRAKRHAADDMDKLAATAEVAGRRARQRAFGRSLADFQRWISEPEAPAVLFRSLKQPPPQPTEVKQADTVLVHPKDRIDHTALHWHQLWAPGPIDEEGIARLFHRIRSLLDSHSLPPLDVALLRRALRAMRPRTGRGVDQMTPLDFERLPDAALQEMVHMLCQAEAVASWPRQVLLVVGRLLGKKSGGERVIEVFSMFTRCWSVLREAAMRDWSPPPPPPPHLGCGGRR